MLERFPEDSQDVDMETLNDLRALAELFLPRHCTVCGATGCRSGLCTLCQRVVGLQLTKPQQVVGLPEELSVVAAGEYNGLLARCLLGYKEHLRTDLTDVLSSGLARSISAYEDIDGPIVLVPVPSSLKSIGRRGFSPAQHLTSAAYKKLPARLQTHVLVSDSLQRVVQLRKTSAQKQMGRFDRQKEIQGTMKLVRGADFSGVRCLLTDDVVTTGASLLEAQKVLEKSGALVLGAATVAWVRRHSAPELSGN